MFSLVCKFIPCNCLLLTPAILDAMLLLHDSFRTSWEKFTNEIHCLQRAKRFGNLNHQVKQECKHYHQSLSPRDCYQVPLIPLLVIFFPKALSLYLQGNLLAQALTIFCRQATAHVLQASIPSVDLSLCDTCRLFS